MRGRVGGGQGGDLGAASSASSSSEGLRWARALCWAKGLRGAGGVRESKGLHWSRGLFGSKGLSSSSGSVTAEFAVLLPVVALMLAMVLAAGTAGVAKLRCIDAARTAARLAARHESSSTVLAAAHSAGPREAAVRLSVAGDLVRVRVTARVSLPLPGKPSVEVDAISVAHLEEEMADG
jgi:hypothetical protein